MKRKAFHYSLVCLYAIYVLLFIINLFIIDINEYIKTIFCVFTIILMIFLIIYLLLLNLKNRIVEVKIKENFWNSQVFNLKSKYNKLCRIFLISSYIIFSIFIFASLIISFIESGSPREIDGLYYLISHGDIIKEISYQEYKIISLIMNQGFNSIVILVIETTLIATKEEQFYEV